MGYFASLRARYSGEGFKEGVPFNGSSARKAAYPIKESRVHVAGLFGFSKKERINLPQNFRKVMRYGRRHHSKSFTLYTMKSEGACNRLGVVVKKEIGSATYRNRIKRYCREFFRLHKHQIRGPFDILILVKKGCAIRRYHEAEHELKRLLVREPQEA